MLEIFLYIVGLIMGFQLGSAFEVYTMRKNIKQLADTMSTKDLIDISNNLTSKIAPNITKLKIEELNNIIYVYDSTSDEFICQGTSIDEAAENFNKRNIGCLGLGLHNNNAIFFVDGKVSTTISK